MYSTMGFHVASSSPVPLIESGIDKPKVIYTGLNSDPELMKIQEIIGLYVNCVVAFFGIAGNVISAIALRRSGLDRSSNILLWTLAVSDATFLCGMINISGRIYNGGDFRGWPGPIDSAMVMYVLWMLHSQCYLVGHFCSMTIPALITTERIIAVFFPFSFQRLVTPTRTWIAVGICFVLAIVNSVSLEYTNSRFYYDFFPEYNISFAIRNRADVSDGLLAYRSYLRYVYSLLKGIIPILYVTIGCIAIGIKIKITSQKRKDMVAKDVSKDNKTTLMLVLICVFYATSNSYYSIARLFPRTDLSYRITIIDDLLLTFNSSVNFIIYVAVNKRLRTIITGVLTCKRHAANS